MTESAIIGLIIAYSQMIGISSEVALSVAQVESGLKANAISPGGDYGVFQLQAKSFPDFTPQDLLNPKVNIPLGIAYLAQIKRECVHKSNNDWLVCYNYGFENAKRVKHPSLFPYVLRVNKRIRENKRNNQLTYYRN